MPLQAVLHNSIAICESELQLSSTDARIEVKLAIFVFAIWH